MINHEMEAQQEEQQTHQQATGGVGGGPTYEDENTGQRTGIMRINRESILTTLREKCFTRLSEQRQQMIKQRRFSS